MTTAPQPTRPGPRPGAAGPVVRAATAVTVLAGSAAAGIAAWASGAPAAVGVLVGMLLVCLFFGIGTLVLDAVASFAPALSLLVALLTYTLTVVLLGAAFAGLSRSGLLEGAVDRRWLGATVIAGTATWLAVQLRASLRARVPVYDLQPALPPADSPAAPPLGEPAGARSRRPEADAR